MNLHHSFQSKLTVYTFIIKQIKNFFASSLKICYNWRVNIYRLDFDVKKIYLMIGFFIFFTNLHAGAFDLDMTVDDDIRKNYDSSKLQKDMNVEDTLPSLPEISGKDDVKVQNPVIKEEKQSIPQYNISAGNLKIPDGTSFDVVSSTKLNDWMPKGSSVKFYNRTPIVKKKFTIPANTVFYGEIIEVHQPQITCNGGLVVVRINSMNYKGQIVPIRGYVTRADDKMIFLNNIKGERTYLKTMWKKGNWGRNLFNKMMTMTISLGGEGSTILLSPFPFAYGTICLGLNTLTSPLTAFFSKGGHVSIPAGSRFRIKLLDDAFIN